jgi:hypothetical protein
VVVLIALYPTSRTGREKWGTRQPQPQEQTQGPSTSLGMTIYAGYPRSQDELLGLVEGGWDGAHGSPDSATQRFWDAKLLFWGKVGGLDLGEGEMYSGELGESRGGGGLGLGDRARI